LLLLVAGLLSHPLPRSSLLPPARLIRQPLLHVLAQLKGLQSELELRMLLILSDAGIASHFHTGRKVAVRYPERPPEDQWGHAYPDLYCRRPRLAIFCDSEQFHASSDARGRDHGVSLALQLQGVTVMRFTGSQIMREPDKVGCMVRAAFDSAPVPPQKSSGFRRDAA
jgi:uncharacterized protein DUF559